jgi:hypothetical protein
VLIARSELLTAFPDRHLVLFETVEEFYPAIESNYAKPAHELVKAAPC